MMVGDCLCHDQAARETLETSAGVLEPHSSKGAQKLKAMAEGYKRMGRRRCFAQMTQQEITQFDCPTEVEDQIAYNLLTLKKRVKSTWRNKGPKFRRANLTAANRQATSTSSKPNTGDDGRASGFHHLRMLFQLPPTAHTPHHSAHGQHGP